MSATPVPTAHGVALLHDLDRLITELEHPDGQSALKRIGLQTPGLVRLRAQRDKLAQSLDPRWVHLYERLHSRYPRAIAAVRAGVCTGCFVTLPPTARGRAQGDEAPVCQGCGRILLWT